MTPVSSRDRSRRLASRRIELIRSFVAGGEQLGLVCLGPGDGAVAEAADRGLDGRQRGSQIVRQRGQHRGAHAVGLPQLFALGGFSGQPLPFRGERRLGGEHLDQLAVGRRQGSAVQREGPTASGSGGDGDIGQVRVELAGRVEARDRRYRRRPAPVGLGCRRAGGNVRAGDAHDRVATGAVGGEQRRRSHAEADPGLLEHGVHGIGGVQHAGRRGGDQLGLGAALQRPAARGRAAVDDRGDGDADDDENGQRENVLGLGRWSASRPVG